MRRVFGPDEEFRRSEGMSAPERPAPLARRVVRPTTRHERDLERISHRQHQAEMDRLAGWIFLAAVVVVVLTSL